MRTYGVDALVTRGANTYGPRQYPEKFLPLFITNAFDGEHLPVYGDGKQRREWLHVDDHCAGIEIALRTGSAGDVYNISGQERENMDVVRRILDLTGASPDLVRHVEDRPGHDRRYAVDSSKLRGLGWTPEHSFDAGGLEETVDVVPREPRVVGADQVRRLPPLLRRAVRRPARLAGELATALARLVAQPVDLRAMPLDRLRAVEEAQDVRALPERERVSRRGCSRRRPRRSSPCRSASARPAAAAVAHRRSRRPACLA